MTSRVPAQVVVDDRVKVMLEIHTLREAVSADDLGEDDFRKRREGEDDGDRENDNCEAAVEVGKGVGSATRVGRVEG